MRVIHILSSIEKRASGPSYSVPALNDAIERGGAKSLLVTTARSERPEGKGEAVFARAGFPARLRRSPDLRRWLRGRVEAGEVEIVHNHGLWLMPNVYPGWSTRGTRVPLVVSPRGTLSAWALRHSWMRKRIMWHLMQRRSIASAALFHATSEAEYRDIRRAGFKQPVAVIGNGVDLPDLSFAKETSCEGARVRRTLLFVGRLHPIKGVDLLLRAWALLEETFPDWDLRIVGPSEGSHRNYLETLARTLSLCRVRFDGALYGQEKAEAYRSADLLVLPTHSENFGMAVAEALAAACPVVTTTGAPWSGLRDHDAGWWLDVGLEPLRDGLHTALGTSRRTLARKGRNGYEWMRRDFSWDLIGARMLEAYRWIGSPGAAPDFVRLD